jgi:hypothetical protein
LFSIFFRGSGSKTATLGDSRHVEMRCVVAGQKIAGFWDYDPDAQKAVVACFEPPSAGLRKRLAAAAEGVGKLLGKGLGHGRSFSLDTDDDLRERVAFVSRLGSRAGAAEAH